MAAGAGHVGGEKGHHPEPPFDEGGDAVEAQLAGDLQSRVQVGPGLGEVGQLDGDLAELLKRLGLALPIAELATQRQRLSGVVRRRALVALGPGHQAGCPQAVGPGEVGVGGRAQGRLEPRPAFAVLGAGLPEIGQRHRELEVGARGQG